MVVSKIRDSMERWIIHEGLSSEEVKNPENTFQITVKHATQYDISADIFEPKHSQGS